MRTMGLLLAVAICLSAFSPGHGPGARFALVLIDADSLACSPCLASFETLCRSIPPAIQEERMLGVLTYRGTAAPSDPRKAGIARTRWAGYSRAAGIRIPTTVDEAHIFNEMNATGTTILLFDPSGGGLKRWAPPFPPGAIEAIVRFLLAPDSRIMGKRP